MANRIVGLSGEPLDQENRRLAQKITARDAMAMITEVYGPVCSVLRDLGRRVDLLEGKTPPDQALERVST